MASLNQSFALQTAMRQNLAMTPQLIQAMELLELPLLNLEQRLQQEAAANPALELGDLAADETGETSETARESPNENLPSENDRRDPNSPDQNNELDCDWSNVYDDTYGSRANRKNSGGDDDETFDPLNWVAERQTPLDEYLEQQLGFLTLDPREIALCRAVIASLDDRGYFVKNLATLGENLDPPPTAAEQKKALAIVQGFSPTGIAATSIADCFGLQLRGLPPSATSELAQKIVRENLDDLANNRLPKIAKTTAATLEQVKAAITALRGLDPYPGKNYARTREPLARPDVFIDLVKASPNEKLAAETRARELKAQALQAERAAECGQIEEYAAREAKIAALDAETSAALFEDDGMKWTVRVASGTAIEISPVFLALFDNTARGRTLRENWERDPGKRERLHGLKTQIVGELRKKFRENFFNAGNIIRAVRQREITLYRLTREVVARQKTYLAGRAPTPSPLMMKELAEKLAMDNGTVSRAMSDKYADTPLGLRPLREFFTRAVAETAPTLINSDPADGEKSGGEKISNGLIRNRIAAIIAAENKSSPLKDHIIQELLANEGILIKRRTVAKHRGLLGIGDYMQRREY